MKVTKTILEAEPCSAFFRKKASTSGSLGASPVIMEKPSGHVTEAVFSSLLVSGPVVSCRVHFTSALHGTSFI